MLSNYNNFIFLQNLHKKIKIKVSTFSKKNNFFWIIDEGFQNKVGQGLNNLINFRDLIILSEKIIKIEKNSLSSKTNLLDFFNKKYFCLKKYFINFSETRVECYKKFNFESYSELSWLKFGFILQSILPKNGCFKDKHLDNIIFLYNIRCYRGWRHIFGLPTKGQRTWSNGNISSSNFNVLKDYMYTVFKEGLSSFHPSEIKNSFSLEQLNIFWMDQWKVEWMYALEKRTDVIRKSKKRVKFEANTLIKMNPNFLRAKKQPLIPIGFEPGYSKYYLKELKFSSRNKDNNANTKT